MTTHDEQLKAVARYVSGRPDWIDAPAVQAWHRVDARTTYDGTPGTPRIWSPDCRTTETWSTPSLQNVHWSDLVDVVPLAVPAGSYTRTGEEAPLRLAAEQIAEAQTEATAAVTAKEKAEQERDEARRERDNLRAQLEADSDVNYLLREERDAWKRKAAEQPRPLDLFEKHRTIWGIREARREFLEQGLTYKDVRRIVELAFTPEPEPTRPEGAEAVSSVLGALRDGDGEWMTYASDEDLDGLADALAERGVRVTGGES